MEKSPTAIPKRGNKQPKSNKKKQPLKVVYITNPIKFNATAAEFRALVQEHTGQDADVSETSRSAAEGNVVVHAPEEVVLGQAEEGAGVGGIDGSDLSYDGGYGGGFYDPQGLAGSNMLWDEDGDIDDVFKSLGAM